MSMLILIYFGVVLILAMTYLISLKPSQLKKRLETLNMLIKPLRSIFASKDVQRSFE